MSTTVKPFDPMVDVKKVFDQETLEHQLVVLKDDGLHRHLRCQKPGTRMWSWDVVTWPGHLSITGDLGAFVFAREPDMLLQFFHGASRQIDVRYWMEKCVSWDRSTPSGGVVSKDRIQQHRDAEVESDPDQSIDRQQAWAAAMQLAEDLDGTTQIDRMVDFLMQEISSDAWDWTITKPDTRALTACLIIAWTHDRYREHLASQVGSDL